MTDNIQLNNAEAVGRFGTKMPTAMAVCGSCAIEVKSTDNVGKGDLKGLKAIADEGGVERRVLVCREPVSRVVDGIEILNFRDFIDRLWSDQLIMV